MIPNWMRWDQKQKFDRCIQQGSDGLHFINTTAGSTSGTNQTGGKQPDIMARFSRAITSDALRVAS